MNPTRMHPPLPDVAVALAQMLTSEAAAAAKHIGADAASTDSMEVAAILTNRATGARIRVSLTVAEVPEGEGGA